MSARDQIVESAPAHQSYRLPVPYDAASTDGSASPSGSPYGGSQCEEELESGDDLSVRKKKNFGHRFSGRKLRSRLRHLLPYHKSNESESLETSVELLNVSFNGKAGRYASVDSLPPLPPPTRDRTRPARSAIISSRAESVSPVHPKKARKRFTPSHQDCPPTGDHEEPEHFRDLCYKRTSQLVEKKTSDWGKRNGEILSNPPKIVVTPAENRPNETDPDSKYVVQIRQYAADDSAVSYWVQKPRKDQYLLYVHPVWGKQPASHSGHKSGLSSSEAPSVSKGTKNRSNSLPKGTESTPRSSTNTITDGQRDSSRDSPVKYETTEAERGSSPRNAEKESENESTDLDPRAYRTSHSRFRQFWVEGFNTGRSRTKSEYPGNNTQINSPHGDSMRMNKPEDTNPASSQSKDLPLHAYTVTGGSTQGTSLLRRLAAYTNLSGTQSDQASIRSGTDSLRRALHSHMARSHHTSEGRSGSVPTPPDYAVIPRGSDKSHHNRSPRGMIGRLMSLSSGSGKSTEDIILPDPSKLPREHPCSTIEFTQTRLKDPKRIPQKFQVKSGIDVLRRQRAGSISGTSGEHRNLYGNAHANARPFILDNMSKSEETLLSMANAKGRRATAFVLATSTSSRHNSGSEKLSGTQLGTEEEEQEEQPVPNPSDPQGRRHGNHGHHRTKGHHAHHSARKSHTMTRVTESRRYLMFTKTLPFWTTKQYMEAHGTGMGDAETYAVLFHHTTCYELMPESAKLVVLDSQLTISKAFKALIYNGIRVAPIWDSTAQTNVAMLTITDFVHMLYQFWDASDTMEIGDFDRLTIHQWKEVGRTETRNNLSAQNLSGSLKSDTNVELVESKSESNGEVSPPCNPSSNPDSRRSSMSTSSSSSSSSRSSAASLPPTLSESQDVSQTEISAASEGDIQSPCCLPSLVHSNTTAGAQTPIRFRSVYPESSLYKCLRIMSRFHLHHLPVIDSPHLGSGNVLYILTLQRLLIYLLSQLSQLPQPRFLQSSLADLNVGTLTNVTVVTPNTRLAEVLPLFESKQVSALPVVESMESRRLINLVSKYDIIALVSSGSFNNPELTIQDWLDVCKTKGSPTSENRGRPPVETCLATNNLLYVIERLVSTGFRRLVVVNNTTDYRVDGIVSLFDVLRFVVLSQPRSSHSHPAPPPSVAEVAEEHDEVTSESEDATHQTKSSPLVRTGTITPKHSLDSGTNRGGTVRRSPDPAPSSDLHCTTGSRQKRNQNPEIKLQHVEDEVPSRLNSHVLVDGAALSSA